MLRKSSILKPVLLLLAFCLTQPGGSAIPASPCWEEFVALLPATKRVSPLKPLVFGARPEPAGAPSAANPEGLTQIRVEVASRFPDFLRLALAGSDRQAAVHEYFEPLLRADYREQGGKVIAYLVDRYGHTGKRQVLYLGDLALLAKEVNELAEKDLAVRILSAVRTQVQSEQRKTPDRIEQEEEMGTLISDSATRANAVAAREFAEVAGALAQKDKVLSQQFQRVAKELFALARRGAQVGFAAEIAGIEKY